MEQLEFTGYEPKPVVAQKMAILINEVRELRAEIEKLKAGDAPAKKAAKAAKSEE